MKSIPLSESQPVESLARVLDVLDLFTRDEPEFSLTKIADRLDWPMATAHRVVSTLVAREFLTREEGTKLLRLGPGVMRLVAPVMSGLAPDLARPHLVQLAADVGETVNFAILDGAEVLYIASGSGSYILRAETPAGLRTPAHCTALGKCMLAQLDADVARRHLGGEPYPALTDSSATTWDELVPQLQHIRQHGYSLSLREYEDGLNSCAVPVATLSGVPAAINVAAASHRVTVEELVDAFVPKLQATADAIARAQGLGSARP